MAFIVDQNVAIVTIFHLKYRLICNLKEYQHISRFNVVQKGDSLTYNKKIKRKLIKNEMNCVKIKKKEKNCVKLKKNEVNCKKLMKKRFTCMR